MQYRARRILSESQITVEIAGTRRSVWLLDVSETGMKIALAGSLPPGTPLKVEAARISLAAVVRWSDERAVGVELDRGLSTGEVAELSGLAWAV
ncbi:PilZ domain-containing protein [Jannaschia marina]|uniref:PilZ domain-containing protein n=1 Tax=Jannaschia marina TaxID=2741674 RepID=UPI0015CD79CD|nr:PilZ domain-containing protein [Jannaschia marina]